MGRHIGQVVPDIIVACCCQKCEPTMDIAEACTQAFILSLHHQSSYIWKWIICLREESRKHHATAPGASPKGFRLQRCAILLILNTCCIAQQHNFAGQI